MRIAYVCADRGVPVFGRKGCSIHVQEVIRAFLAAGASVELVAARTGGPPPRDLEVVHLHDLSVAADGTGPAARERAGLRANVAVRRILDRLGPVDLVYERYSLWSFAAMRWARRSHVPGLLEVNAPLIEEQAAYRSLCLEDVATRVAFRSFAAARAIIAVSREVARWIRRFDADRVHVIPNGVDPSRFAVHGCVDDWRRPSVRHCDGVFTIGFVGTLKAWHGLRVLIDAFAELHAESPAIRLLLVGDGPEREALEDGLERRGLRQAAVFTGAVDPLEVPTLLRAMDVAVAPYSARPAFYFSPLKVLEYMAAELPVVASRLGQLEELIDHGHSGLLCTPDDPAALADCLGRLRRSAPLRRRLGRAARASVARDHTWAAVVRRSLALAGIVLPCQPTTAFHSPAAATEVRA